MPKAALAGTADHVVLMGTKGGPAIRPGSTMPTSSVLQLDGQTMVVDCGLGVTRGLCDHGVALPTIDTIFITHLHSDHYLELGPLLHTAWTAGLATPVDVWGPPGLGVYWAAFLASMQADINLRIADEGRVDMRTLVTIHTLDAGHVATRGQVAVGALRVSHTPLVDCFALSFRSPTRHVVFSGDTAYFPALADFAQGADLLVHEAILEPALKALVARVGNGDDRLMRHLRQSHTTAQDAGRIATAADVGALALNHLIPSDDPAFGPDDWHAAIAKTWHGKLHIGADGLRIDI